MAASSTVSNVVSSLVSAAATAPSPTPTNRAPPQGGIIEGANPTIPNPKDPIILFIIQAGIILIVCHLLHWPLSKIRQPRVIAEVVGGILLGPSVLGRVPGFRDAIFPASSIEKLNLVANLGLVLYLFMIGLETDVHFLLSNWRIATSVAVAGMALPFGLGCALAWGLYQQFADDQGVKHIQFSTFMLFIGVAIAITAFPVLCRILTELKLLDTSVGVIVLSAGVANDVVGWILLALCVTLVNAGSGLTALWILLACVGFLLFLLFVVRPILIWVLRRSGSIKAGPSQSIIALILLIALGSAFFTGSIGVHAIFGGFMVGLIIPREHAFNIKVTEKLEDLVGALFLPLYFTLSGLNTDLGLLNSGMTWAYVFAVTLVAFFAKFIGATLAARFNQLVWRESATIGVLMSCKGLVELIVLNIGLQANILSKRTFTIFVVMALITTFSTTPLTMWLYPSWYQKKLEAWKRGEIDWDTGAPLAGDATAEGSQKFGNNKVDRLLIYLRLDTMPAILEFMSLFGKPPSSVAHVHPSDAAAGGGDATGQEDSASKRVVRAHGIRLLGLTDRDSSVMTVSQVDDLGRHDPVVNTFRTVGQLHNIAVSGEVAVVPEDRFGEVLLKKSLTTSSDLLLIPWSESGKLADTATLSSVGPREKRRGPYASFVKSVLEAAEHNVAVFFPKSDDSQQSNGPSDQNKLSRTYSFTTANQDFEISPVILNKSHHLFLPYLGGPDDKVALRLVLQLCLKADVTATVVRILASADNSTNVAHDDYWDWITAQVSAEVSPRIKFRTLSVPDAKKAAVDEAAAEFETTNTRQSGSGKFKLIVMGRRAGADEAGGRSTLKAAEEAKDCLGVLAGLFIASSGQADLLVVQAKV